MQMVDLGNRLSAPFFSIFNMISNNEKVEAYLEIEIADIQFHQMNGDKLRYTGLFFTRIYHSKNGDLLWSQSDFFSGFNGDLFESELHEYNSDSAKLRYAASVLSQMLAVEFIKKLDGRHDNVDYDLHNRQSHHPLDPS